MHSRARKTRPAFHFDAVALRWLAKPLLALAVVWFALPTHAAGPEGVSLEQLLAKPGKYDGKAVQVTGYLHLEFEGNSLYRDKKDYEQGHYQNALWIDLTELQLKKAAAHNDRYVVVIGTFDAEDRGHLGLWPGALSKVQRIHPGPTQ
jgi:hypothetical protein